MAVYNGFNLELERDTLSPFIKPSGRRRRLNLCRKWNAFSRLQRSLLAILTLGLTLISFLYILAYYDSIKDRYSKNFILKDERRINKPKIAKPLDVSSDRTQFSGPKNDRQRAIVKAFQHAWRGYKNYSWGYDHLRPISKTPHNWFGLGLTIVDSLDTMFIMGLRLEFDEAREWVANKLNFDVNNNVNFFETTIRVLGGLLSAYHLSNDRMFLDKAKDLGDRLSGAFNTKHKIPYSDINLATKDPEMPTWSTDSSLSEITTVQLEFRDLSRSTNDPIYEQLAFNVSKHVHNLGCAKHDGLCPMFLNPKNGRWRQGTVITMGARADSYYEYLLKQWLQTGKKIDWLKIDYLQAMKGMAKHLLRLSEPNKLMFVGELLNGESFSPKMDHLVCFISGTLALGALNKLPTARSNLHLDYAKKLGRTCHEMYKNPTGLGPEIAHFNLAPSSPEQSSNDMFIKSADAHCLLRPEAIEAWFYLYRATGNKIYQDWGWKAFEAIEKYAKVDVGYSSIHSVKKTPVAHRDMMESFFLAETLKYLYLLFDDIDTKPNLFPLDKYVFNTEGHPLPIYDNAANIT